MRYRNAQRSSLPVFSVDTEDEAQYAIGRYCIHRYDGSWRWTDWPKDLDGDDWQQTSAALDGVTAELREWWNERHPADE